MDELLHGHPAWPSLALVCQLMMSTNCGSPMYADDLALVASSPEELQAMLDIVATYMLINGSIN